MNIKRIVLCIAVVMIAIISLSMVNAGMFDFISGGDNNVNGIDFNIPDGFSRQNTENVNDSTKVYFSNEKTLLTIIVHDPDPNITSESFNNNISNRFDQYQKKTISGHNGFMLNFKKNHRTYFTYLDDIFYRYFAIEMYEFFDELNKYFFKNNNGLIKGTIEDD